MTDENIARYIAILVAVVWLASFILDAFWKSYDPPDSLSGMMMIVVGWAVSSDIRKRGGKMEMPEEITELDKGDKKK